MYKFDAKKVKDECVAWIKNWMNENGEGCNSVVAISGGKDSSIVAGLCVEALGKDRVKGVLLPNGVQTDIQDSLDLVNHLGIEFKIINIEHAVNSIISIMQEVGLEVSEQTKINLPPRIRMSATYAYSQSINGRVANTSNLSEDYVGYFTKNGDGAGDFSPLANLTVTEVKAIGRELGLPEHLIEKVPLDGLCGKTDEDNLGFTYAVLDKYLREGTIDDVEIQEKIERMHYSCQFKFAPMPMFIPDFMVE